MIREEQWRLLALANQARTPGLAWKRLFPSSGHDLFMAVAQPGSQRCIWIDFEANHAPPRDDLPQLRSINVGVAPSGEGRARCEIRLQAPELGEVFSAMATDVTSAVATAPNGSSAAQALTARLQRWRRLLEPGPESGLSRRERIGLYGELAVLNWLIESGVGCNKAVSSWTGPLNAHQDFQFPSGAVEVKSTATKEPQALKITSERELDPTGIESLCLAHLSFDERMGGTGQSLPEIVARTELLVPESETAIGSFRQLLRAAGYLSEHVVKYAEPHYSLRASHFYEVRGAFPRIVEGELRAGVGDVSYSVQKSAMQPFECGWEAVSRMIGG